MILKGLQLAEWVGTYNPSEVVVITDSGYDGKKFQRSILDQGWGLLTAIKSNRSAQTLHELKTDPKKYRKISKLFRSVRKQAPWEAIRVRADGGKRKEFRARRLEGRIRGIRSRMALVCSEKTRRKGRMYFACSNTRISTGVLIRAYRRRWRIETWYKEMKQKFGYGDCRSQGAERSVITTRYPVFIGE